MNYFRCTVGGSGGKFKLTVTCDSGFAGATISCTDGTTTLTATCPSSSPYTVIFKIPNGGTWIVSSGSNSTTVVISDTATLHQIPTGSTATPVNDIQTWLHCANIWNKTYTTINQVLADTSTLLALISSNNAADYMARSTNWASSVCANATAMGYIGNNDYCANKLLANSTWLNAICNSAYFESVLNVKVPTMTGYTTPSGVVSGTTEYNYNYLWYAFDKNSSKGAYCNVTNADIIYQFPTAKKIYKWVFTSLIAAFGTQYIPNSATLYGSNNGSSWTQLGSLTGFSSSVITKTLILSGATAYKYYKTTVNASDGSGAEEIQYYGRNA